jgi:hypothetical protein
MFCRSLAQRSEVSLLAMAQTKLLRGRPLRRIFRSEAEKNVAGGDPSMSLVWSPGSDSKLDTNPRLMDNKGVSFS